MIWYFGTSHTAGQCIRTERPDFEGKALMREPYAKLVSNAVGHDYLNFAQQGSDNTEIYFLLRCAVLDKSLEDPDIIIIEPRPHYDLPLFPAWKSYRGERKNKWLMKPMHPNNVKSDLWKEYTLNVHRQWRRLNSSTDKVTPDNEIKNKRFLPSIENTIKNLKKHHQTDTIDKAYTSWLGEWWDSFMEYWVNIQQSEHIVNKLKLEMEIAGMTNVAKSRASKVGYMFWDKPKRGITNFINKDDCIISDVRSWLEENENEAYKRSLEECTDDHLGPSAHKAITKPIVEWINGS